MLIFKITRNKDWSGKDLPVNDYDYEFEAYLLTVDGEIAKLRVGQPDRLIYANGSSPAEVIEIIKRFADSLDLPFRYFLDSSWFGTR